MANLDDDLENDDLARIMVYGPPGSRKTWWATRAAELGFNVILADLDNGYKITRQLSPEARKRVFRLDMRAPNDGYDNCGAMALAHAMNGNACYFDEETRKYVGRSKIEAGKKYIHLDFTKLTARDVLIIDSWTIFVQQLGLVSRRVLDPIKIAKFEWDDYAKIRLVLDHVLSNMKGMNCHVIVVGHSETNAKRKKNAAEKEKPETAIEQIRLQPSSATRAHGEVLAASFSDVLYFEIPSALQGTTIETSGSVDFDAKSRSLAPKIYKWTDLDFSPFVSPAHLDAVAGNTKFDTEGLREITAEDLPVSQTNAQINVGAGTGFTLNIGKKS